jgi:N-acetylmuramoyl-L-alanine amidase
MRHGGAHAKGAPRAARVLAPISLMGARMDIVVDPGHGGERNQGKSSSSGGYGPNGTLEKDVTLRLAQLVSGQLGPDVTLTRTGDNNLSLAARSDVARRSGARVFLSLHTSEGAATRGAEAWIHNRASRGSAALAQSLARSLQRLGGPDRGVRRGELAVLTPERLDGGTAACLLEVDLLSDGRTERFGGPDELERTARAIADGVTEYLRGVPRFGSPAFAFQHARALDDVTRVAAEGPRNDSSQAVPILSQSMAAPMPRALDIDINTACDICAAALPSMGFPAREIARLSCLFSKVRDSAVDDRYVNGFDYILRTLTGRLNDDQMRSFLDQYHVRADVIQAAGVTGATQKTYLDLLDQRFLEGIAFLNRMMYTQGAAINPGHLQVKDWVAARQHDSNSVYWCYGDGQS